MFNQPFLQKKLFFQEKFYALTEKKMSFSSLSKYFITLFIKIRAG